MKVNEAFRLDAQVAIVTGGATHLGRAMATALGELGAKVVIASRRRELCETVAGDMRKEGIDCIGLGCDVTKEEEVNSLLAEVENSYDRIDVMVCNAGGSATTTYLPNASIEEFVRTWEINVKSSYLCAQAASRLMIPQRRGKIITIGSIHGSLSADKRFYEGLNFQRSGPPYQTAKGCVIQLTRALAAELGEHGITVNCISPGQIPKPETDPDMVERCRAKIPLGRTGVPEDLKGTVALLASRAGDWITGQNLVVDGGWSIC